MNKESSFSFASLARALAVCSFVVLGLSSLALFVAPSCSVARLTGWTFGGICKDSWESLNTWFGFVAILAALLYVATHGRDLMNWIRARAGKPSTEFVVALVLCGVLALGSIGEIGPFASFNRWHEVNKHAQAAGMVSATASHDSCSGESGCDEDCEGCDKDQDHCGGCENH